MSKGIWTKHLVAVDGETRAFYYNASQQRSVWFSPKDGVVAEAVNLTLASTTPDSQGESKKNPDDIAADELLSQILSGDPQPSDGTAEPQQVHEPLSATSSMNIQERIQQAINNNKEKVLAQSSSANKRFKSSQQNGQEHLSDYERQKIELEAMAGSKGENAGKWLVR